MSKANKAISSKTYYILRSLGSDGTPEYYMERNMGGGKTLEGLTKSIISAKRWHESRYDDLKENDIKDIEWNMPDENWEIVKINMIIQEV